MYKVVDTTVPQHHLRPSDKLLLREPSCNLKLYGYHAFSVCAPWLWIHSKICTTQ